MLQLDGVRVLDVSAILSVPLCCQILGEFGANVIKVKHPRGLDNMRGRGARRDGVPLLWKVVTRNKRTAAISRSEPVGAEAFRRLAVTADVLVKNFRPTRLERRNLPTHRLQKETLGWSWPGSPAGVRRDPTCRHLGSVRWLKR